jgi:membrane protein
MEKLTRRLDTWFALADARTRGTLGILGATARQLSLVRAPEAAASLAYYAIFTLFPLLILLVALGTSFLRSDVVYEAVANALGGVFPVVGEELIESALKSLMLQRTSIGVLGLISLLWAASSFFAVLVQHVNLAFPAARPSGLIRHRLLALLIVLLVLVLFIGALILSGAAGLLRSTQVFALLPGEPLWRSISFLLPWVFTFLMFSALYRWIPTHGASWRATCIGALVATVAWQLAAMAFGLFVSSGLVNYEVVYGSLAAFVALLFWIYLSCYIVLLGAHLAGAVDARHRR